MTYLTVALSNTCMLGVVKRSFLSSKAACQPVH